MLITHRPARVPRALASWVAIGMLSAAPAAAQPFPDPRTDVAEAAVVVQDLIASNDFFMLTLMEGVDVAGFATYASETDPAAWAGTLTGTYFGLPLSVAYVGSSAGAFGSPMTWTSAGTYGTDAWSGGGSVLFTPTASGFDVMFQSTLAVGPMTGEANILGVGTVTPTTLGLEASGDVEVNGRRRPRPPRVRCVTLFRWGKDLESGRDRDLQWCPPRPTDPGGLVFSRSQQRAGIGGRGYSYTVDFRVRVIPEPTTLPLLGFGVVAIGLAARRRTRAARP